MITYVRYISSGVPSRTVTPRRLVRPSILTDVSDVVMILINIVMMIRPANIHTSPSSLPGIVLGAISPYLKIDFSYLGPLPNVALLPRRTKLNN